MACCNWKLRRSGRSADATAQSTLKRNEYRHEAGTILRRCSQRAGRSLLLRYDIDLAGQAEITIL
jgi:hypothetical protein